MQVNLSNEILLILNLVVVFGGVLLFYKLFQTTGLICFTVFATITANIEVMLLVDAFGMEQTLGNIMFASTFLITDILSETEGKKKAREAVLVGILTSLAFIVISHFWLMFTPSENDWAYPYMETIFSNTPRIMLAGFLVYAVVQWFDVWIYHKWWDFTTKRFGNRQGFLWLRNNGSTLISQLLNAFLFNFAAFGSVYDVKTLVSISLSTYVIYFATSILDTPFIYLARRMHRSF